MKLYTNGKNRIGGGNSYQFKVGITIIPYAIKQS